MDVSVVIPCYNEVPHLVSSVRTLTGVLDFSKLNYEIIFVNDCSTDDTGSVLEEICGTSNSLQVLHHEHNRGRGGAFKTGFQKANGIVVGFIDIDLEIGAYYVPELVREILECNFDVVIGRRYYLLGQTHAWFRHILSRGYLLFCRLALGYGNFDSETGCKFFRRSTTSGVVLNCISDGWFWDTEVMARSVYFDLKIREFPVLFLRRQDKGSTVRLVADIADYIREIYHFRKRGFNGKPLGLYSGSWPKQLGQLAASNRLFGATLLETIFLDQTKSASSVVEFGCGAIESYCSHKKSIRGDYLAMDPSWGVVKTLRKRGVHARLYDREELVVPNTDVIIISFEILNMEEHGPELLHKCVQAASTRVLVFSSAAPKQTNSWLSSQEISGRGKTNSLEDQKFSSSSLKKFSEIHNASSFDYEDKSGQSLAVFESTPLATNSTEDLL